MLAWTKHGDVVQFFTPLIHDESRQHWDLFLKTQWFVRSLTTANQSKIERKNGRQTIAFFNKIHDVFQSNARYWQQYISRCLRENVPSIKYKKSLFLQEKKTVASWSCSGFSHHIFDHEIRRKFRLEYSLFLLFASRTPSFLPCTTMRAFY